MCCNNICIFSSGKVVQSALIPMLLENTDSLVFVTTTTEKFMGISSIGFNGMPELDYRILYAGDNDTLDVLKSRMIEHEVRVAIINIHYPIFQELIELGNGGVWLSACRDGIFMYLDLFQDKISKPTTVLCFDNDATLVQAAIEKNKNKYINIEKCVVHSVCSQVDYDDNKQQATLCAGKECLVIFPPSALFFREFLKNHNPLTNKRTQLRFTQTDDEFRFYSMAKLINVNAIHTLICCIAYVEGVTSGYMPSQIASMQINQLLREDSMMRIISDVHSKLYQYYLAAIGDKLNESYDIHLAVMQSFISLLFSSGEKVSRGLDIASPSYANKTQRHFPLLKGINDDYVNQIISTMECL